MERAVLKASVIGKDFSFLEKIPQKRYDDVIKLGEGYAYLFGHSLLAAGHIEESRLFFSAGFERDKYPYNILCLEELMRTGSAEQRLAAAESWLNLFRSEGAGFYPSGFSLPPELDAGKVESLKGELLVSLGRHRELPVKVDEWFSSRPLSGGMAELYSELQGLAPEDSVVPLSEFLRATKARIDLRSRRYQASWTVFRELLQEGSPYVFSRFILSDACKAALYGGTSADAAFLESRFAEASTNKKTAQFMLSFYSARIRQKNGDASAPVLFEKALGLSETENDYDTALWYLLDSLRPDRQRFIDAVRTHAPSWHDRAWYSDVLDAFIVECVRLRDWKSIGMLKDSLSGRTDPSTEARLSWLCARTGAGGWFTGTKTREELYLEAYEGDHDSLYYRFLSADALGIPIASYAPDRKYSASMFGGDPAAAGGDPAAAGGDPAAAGDRAESPVSGDFLASLAEWGMSRQAYALLSRFDTVLPELAVRLSSLLSAQNEHDLALRAAVLGLRRSAGPVTDDLLKSVYPRPWLEAVSGSAARFGIEEYVMYALIRSESFFNPDAASSAGAVGLAQLMPATAADVARKLKAEEYDLRDPSTNILFGTYYLAELRRRLDGNILEAFFAYNAGITRVREWKKTAGDLSADLFLESLPYGETREYGRKVLAAAALYGYLYYQKSAGQTVREIFR